MLHNTDISPGQWRRSAPVSQEGVGDDSLQALIDQLGKVGFDLPVFFGKRKNMVGGIPIRLSVRSLMQSAAAFDIASNAVLTTLKDRVPLTLSLTDLGSEQTAIATLQSFCESLRAEMDSSKLRGDVLGICIHSHQLPLQAFQVITKSVLGNGPRYVLLDSLQMTQHCNPVVQSETDKNWAFLWRNRKESVPLKPAYGATVRTACPLLSDEVTASVLPVCGVQVPVDSAWLPVVLQLQHFADDAGNLRWEQLLPALASGVEIAEGIMDRLCWLLPGQRADAHLNRRLAISITGLGDLVARRGDDPRNLATLERLCIDVARIRRTLWHRSSQLARSAGCVPALCGNDPSSRWDDTAHRENWRRRWQTALDKSAVRHRNMLVLSPYSVLPSTGTCSAAYTDLLPAIAYADAWSFADVPDFRGWNLNDYKVFHRRAWALIQGRHTGSLVAAGV